MATIDPYGSELANYHKVIKEFGLEPFSDIFPEPNRLMRRGVTFAGRDLGIIANAIKEKKPFYCLSVIMPTAERVHFGTKMVVDNLRYFQEHGAKTYILVADLEACTARGVPLVEARERALNFHIPAYLALGLDPKKTTFYFQSENKAVIHFAFEAAKKVTLNEFKAIYGTADPSRILAASVQVADILYPQFEKPTPGIIPVGIDQDPHLRLARDVVRRFKERKFFPPSALYHQFMPSLDGQVKMSKSMAETSLDLGEEAVSARKKISRALTGGRETVEIQRKLGGVPEKCMVFELYKQHLVEDDGKLSGIHSRCKAGTLLCGEDKQQCADLLCAYLESFSKKLEAARKKTDTLHFVRF